MRALAYLTLAIATLAAACQGNNNNQQDTKTDSIELDTGLVTEVKVDTIQRIRDNYERIHAIKDWDRIDSAEVLGESTEGGIAYFYYKNNVMEKMDIEYYGEGGYTNDYYYFKDNQVSFVLEEIYRYNAHMYSPEFDYAKTKKAEEFRFYYFEGKFVKGLPEQADPKWQVELADRAAVLLQQKEKISKLKRY